MSSGYLKPDNEEYGYDYGRKPAASGTWRVICRSSSAASINRILRHYENFRT